MKVITDATVNEAREILAHCRELPIAHRATCWRDWLVATANHLRMDAAHLERALREVGIALA
jgi:hypothetical protein